MGITSWICTWYICVPMCVYLIKAVEAMILTIINHYILINSRFFHVQLKDVRKLTPLSFARMFKARDKQTLIRSVPFKED